MGAIDAFMHEPAHGKNGFTAEEKAALDAPEVWPEVDALLEKIQRLTKANERLRELVVQLSVLVLRNVVGPETYKSLPIDAMEPVRS